MAADPSFSCTVCGQTYKSRPALRYHNKAKHTNERHVCTTCGKGFVEATRLREHVVTHSAEKLFECAVCDKSFKTQRAVDRHVSMHTGEKPHGCDECRESFRNASTLRTHVLRAHRPRDSWPYHCEVCGKAKTQKSELARHMQIHEWTSGLQCKECGSDHNSVYDLRIHRKMHSDRKPFRCPLCRRNFKRKDTAQRHVKDYHDADDRRRDRAIDQIRHKWWFREPKSDESDSDNYDDWPAAPRARNATSGEGTSSSGSDDDDDAGETPVQSPRRARVTRSSPQKQKSTTPASKQKNAEVPSAHDDDAGDSRDQSPVRALLRKRKAKATPASGTRPLSKRLRRDGDGVDGGDAEGDDNAQGDGADGAPDGEDKNSGQGGGDGRDNAATGIPNGAGADEFKCGQCGKPCGSQIKLERHTARRHNGASAGDPDSADKDGDQGGGDAGNSAAVGVSNGPAILNGSENDGELFKCTVPGCGKPCGSQEKLERHTERRHAATAPAGGDSKPRGGLEKLERHTPQKLPTTPSTVGADSVTGDGEAFKCRWPGCGKPCGTPEKLERHTARRHANAAPATGKEGQGSDGSRNDALNGPGKVGEPFKCNWPGCGKPCGTPEKLERHTARRHAAVTPGTSQTPPPSKETPPRQNEAGDAASVSRRVHFPCHVCDAVCSSREERKRHMMTKHAAASPQKTVAPPAKMASPSKVAISKTTSPQKTPSSPLKASPRASKSRSSQKLASPKKKAPSSPVEFVTPPQTPPKVRAAPTLPPLTQDSDADVNFPRDESDESFTTRSAMKISREHRSPRAGATPEKQEDAATGDAHDAALNDNQCAMCDKKFKSPRKLRKHVAKAHDS